MNAGVFLPVGDSVALGALLSFSFQAPSSRCVTQMGVDSCSTDIDHIEHVAKVAGVDHTCLGSDFDGVPAMPAGMEDASKLPALTAALRARGFSAADVEKILGGNVLRVLEANEKR